MTLLKRLNTLAITYAVVMTLVAVGFASSEWTGKPDENMIMPAILLLHALAQLIYSLKTGPLLSMDRYEEYETLDNRLMFDREGDIVQQHAVIVVLACIASFVELVVAYLGVQSIRGLFSFNFDNGERIASFIFHISGILLAVPALIFNLRTWNIKCIVVKDMS